MEPVRYGVVGLGQVSSKGHIPSLLAIPEARITAVATSRPGAVPSTVGEVRTHADWKDLLKDDAVEAVLIATPNWLHREQAVAAFEAGKHVFCEKPPGVDLDECDAILAARDASGKLLQVGHEMRCSNLVRCMRERIDEGLIGAVQMIVFEEFRFPLRPGWRQTGKTGGVMLEKNSHFFDLFNHFIDARPQRVVAVGGNNVNKESPLIDHCVVTVEYGNAARATLCMCLFADHGSQPTMHVVGDKGRLIAWLDDQRVVFHSRGDAEPREWVFETDEPFHPGFRLQHEAFIRSVRNGDPIAVDGETSRAAMAVSLAAERAVGGEIVVKLED